MVRGYHSGEPVATTAPALHEVVHGWSALGGERAANSLRFLLDKIAGDAIIVLPFGWEAAILAGRLQARNPELPPARRGDGRSRRERQRAWQMDILVASSAYAAGYGVETTDLAHFTRIAAMVAEEAPGGPELELAPGPLL